MLVVPTAGVGGGSHGSKVVSPLCQARNKEYTPGERAKWEDMMLKAAHPRLLGTSLSFKMASYHDHSAK